MRQSTLASALVLAAAAILANRPTALAAPTQCTPGSCDDNNPCTTDTCDPVQGCIYTPINCDDGNVCTVDSCSQGGVPGIATLLIGHDTQVLEQEYQKNGSLVQTWGVSTHVTGAAVDGSGVVYICDPSYGNNVIAKRGPGNTNLGSITAVVNNRWIEDLGNYGGGFILASVDTGGIYRINTTNGADTLLFTTGHNLPGVTYDGTNIWTTGGSSNTFVYKRDLAGNVLSSFNTGQTNGGIGYDPDDGTLWVGHANGQITHHSQAGALLGGFTTTDSQWIDGLELGNLLVSGGCQHPALNCNDNDFCTDDACDPMTGCYHPAHSCDDTNPCTDDVCSGQFGCMHSNNTAPCDDSNVCTTGETCSGGYCQGGTPTNCDDNNVCTDDTCDNRFGCQHANNTNFCNDGNACTVEDVCVNGVCQAGFPATCNDNNACTADSCVPAMGCVYTPVPNGAACDDGSVCTTGDVCVSGTCHGAPVVCAAPDQCHVGGTCDPVSGACTYSPKPNGTACNDGNPCTANDVCVNGVCKGTAGVIPAETTNMAAAADKATYTWSEASDATSYDAARGSTGSFPVGSSSTGEVCLGNTTTARVVDGATPAPGTGFWYLSRARNPCGPGPWGYQSNGTARVTGTCP